MRIKLGKVGVRIRWEGCANKVGGVVRIKWEGCANKVPVFISLVFYLFFVFFYNLYLYIH